MIVPTNRVQRQLRRFVFSSESPCPGPFKYHNGHTPFPEGTVRAEKMDDGYEVWRFDDDKEIPPHDDVRWPIKCDDCAYVFGPNDQWQLFHDVVYARKDTGETMTLRDCPPGAMYDATWYPDKGPDGISLCVALPPGGGHDYWHVDGHAKGGGKWTRTGTAPNVTASPSILTPRYHGFLRGGFLEEC
jgi:hypothetical protein